MFEGEGSGDRGGDEVLSYDLKTAKKDILKGVTNMGHLSSPYSTKFYRYNPSSFTVPKHELHI